MTETNIAYIEKMREKKAISINAAMGLSEDKAAGVYAAVKEIKQQIEALKEFMEEGIDILKLYMGDNETLISNDGRKLATWNWVRGAVTIDRKALEENFADVFEIVKIDKSEEKIRKFTLK